MADAIETLMSDEKLAGAVRDKKWVGWEGDVSEKETNRGPGRPEVPPHEFERAKRAVEAWEMWKRNGGENSREKFLQEKGKQLGLKTVDDFKKYQDQVRKNPNRGKN